MLKSKQECIIIPLKNLNFIFPIFVDKISEASFYRYIALLVKLSY
jgi:hypothetical protein